MAVTHIIGPMEVAWNPLSAREGKGCLALREEIPASLEGALRAWIERAVRRLGDNGRRLMIRLDLVLPDSYVQQHKRAYAKYKEELKQHSKLRQGEARAAEDSSTSSPTPLVPSSLAASYVSLPSPPPDPRPQFLAYGTPTSILLDVIDGMLQLLPYRPRPAETTDPVLRLVRRARRAMQSKDREELQQLLSDGHMIFRVRANGSGLERQVSAVATASALTAADAATEAGNLVAAERLVQAWNKLYALRPDASGAYVDAVRAVEAVANPMFLPAARTPTLGQVLAHLEQAHAHYEFVLADGSGQPADISAVLEMIRALWRGHRDRHEGGPISAPISQESAAAAVSLAVSLVQLLSAGAVRRKP